MLSRLLGTLVLLVLLVLLTRPADASADVRVFVTNEKSDDVTVIDATTRAVVKTIAVGKRPRGVAVSPDGRRVFRQQQLGQRERNRRNETRRAHHGPGRAGS